MVASHHGSVAAWGERIPGEGRVCLAPSGRGGIQNRSMRGNKAQRYWRGCFCPASCKDCITLRRASPPCSRRDRIARATGGGRRNERGSSMGILVMILVGLVAGWLAGKIVQGTGFGLIGDIVIGIVGAVIAGFLFPRLGFSLGGEIIGAIISATIGAVLL